MSRNKTIHVLLFISLLLWSRVSMMPCIAAPRVLHKYKCTWHMHMVTLGCSLRWSHEACGPIAKPCFKTGSTTPTTPNIWNSIFCGYCMFFYVLNFRWRRLRPNVTWKISNQQPQNTRAQPCIVASHVLSDRFQTIYHEEDLARPRMKAWRICMSAGMIACAGIAYFHQVFGFYHRMKFKHVMMCDVWSEFQDAWKPKDSCRCRYSGVESCW